MAIIISQLLLLEEAFKSWFLQPAMGRLASTIESKHYLFISEFQLNLIHSNSSDNVII